MPVLLLLGAVIAFLFIDSIAKQAIERGGFYALGVETELDSTDIGLFSGQFRLDVLHVANPRVSRSLTSSPCNRARWPYRRSRS